MLKQSCLSASPSRILGAIRIRSCLLAVFALAFMLSVPSRAQSAQTWDRHGQAAEAREDYDAAYSAYKIAHEKKPQDLSFKTHLEEARFKAGTQHIDRGRVLRQSGDYSGAMKSFMRAAEIDPSNETAAQEIRVTQNEEAASSANSKPTHEAQDVERDQLLKDYATLAAPVTLKPLSNEPITYHAVEDTKNIYTSLGKAAGLNVIFDPDYQSKRISVDLVSVSTEEAFRVVGTLSGTFFKPVTPNTILVVQNNRAKRTDLEELAVQTFYLASPDQQNDANEILVALRNLLDPSIKIYLVSTQDAIVLRGTPDQLLLAGKLINDLDRARPEVVVDVAVLEVDKDKTRTLGLTLPQSFGLTPQASNSNNSNNSNNNNNNSSNNGGSGNQSPSGFTLNTLASLNATNFAVSVTGATVNALLNDSDTRILQNPRLRASDGQKASLRIGQKVPVATGSLSSPVGGVASLGVQTQFTYIDVGVNMDITPTVHSDGKVSLKMKVEVSQVASYDTISGVQEPVIGQRVMEQTIKLNDGEPSILSGLITKQDSASVSGTPGLGELPVLKYLFSSRTKTLQDDEIVVLLVPHIIRETLLEQFNLRPIDTGTANAIELRHDQALNPNTAFLPVSTAGSDLHSLPQTSAATAATAMLGEFADQASRSHPQPPSRATETDTLPKERVSTASKLSFDRDAIKSEIGEPIHLAVLANSTASEGPLSLLLHFDPLYVSLNKIENSDSKPPSMITQRLLAPGLVGITVPKLAFEANKQSQRGIFALEFRALARGKADITLMDMSVMSDGGEQNPPDTARTTVQIEGGRQSSATR